MYRIEELITIASEKGASDVHLIAGLPPKCRIDGLITNLTEETLTHEDCEEYGRQLAREDVSEILHRGQLDLSAAIAGRRIRINLFRQQGALSASLRLLSNTIPRLQELGLPDAVRQFSRWNKGIVLVTGETGSGKSTTLAAILDQINQTRPVHIITLEDPIEYVYTPQRAIINQREVGVDVEDYEHGLYASLREDPDVILILDYTGDISEKKNFLETNEFTKDLRAVKEGKIYSACCSDMQGSAGSAVAVKAIAEQLYPDKF